MEIKPIETEYNGHRFRSRLEARWAVFFDTLGVKYEYEPEGFELPSGGRYLPDFRVKCYGTRGGWLVPDDAKVKEICKECFYCNSLFSPYYCEAKGVLTQKIDTSKTLRNNLVSCSGFDQEKHEPFDLYIEVKGKMTEEDASKITEFSAPEGNYSLEQGGMPKIINQVLVVGKIPDKGHSFDSERLGSYEYMDEGEIYPFNYYLIDGDYFGAFPAAYKGKFFLWGDDGNYIWNVDEVEKAYTAARQARFEYGEKGGQ